MSKAYPSVLLWQGFKHRWDYNHRVKRLGSYIHHRIDYGGPRHAIVNHTGASGWGDDKLTFADYYARIARADGVWFQTGYWDFELDCTRGKRRVFRKAPFTAPLDTPLQGLKQYAVFLNGFDLRAENIADKLMDFDLRVGNVKPAARSLSFDITGSLKFDCQSLECLTDDLTKSKAEGGMDLGKTLFDRFENIARGIRLDRLSVKEAALENALSKRVKAVERDDPVLAADLRKRQRQVAAARRLYAKHKKEILKVIRRATSYHLRVYFVIVGGNRDALNVCRDFDMGGDHHYAWGKGEDIPNDKRRVPARFTGHKPEFEHHVPGLTRLRMSSQLNPKVVHHVNQFDCPAMHLQEWNAAIHSPRVHDDRVDVTMELCFQPSYRGMERTKHTGSSYSHPFAGEATLSAEAALLEFNGDCEMKPRTGFLEWGGIAIPTLQTPEKPTKPIEI